MQLYLVWRGFQFVLYTEGRLLGMTPMSRPKIGTLPSKYSSLLYFRVKVELQDQVYSVTDDLLCLLSEETCAQYSCTSEILGELSKTPNSRLHQQSEILISWCCEGKTWATRFSKFSSGFRCMANVQDVQD